MRQCFQRGCFPAGCNYSLPHWLATCTGSAVSYVDYYCSLIFLTFLLPVSCYSSWWYPQSRWDNLPKEQLKHREILGYLGVRQGSLLQAVLQSHSATYGWALGRKASSLRDTEPTKPGLGWPPRVRICFPSAQRMLFCLGLKCVHHRAPVQPHCFLSSQGGDGVSLGSTGGAGKLPCVLCQWTRETQCPGDGRPPQKLTFSASFCASEACSIQCLTAVYSWWLQY